jgi:hypothetical protein
MTDKIKGKYPYPLPESFYGSLSEKLYTPLILGENSVLLCPPLYGRDHIVLQLWERISDRKKVLRHIESRFRFANVQLSNIEHNRDTVWLDQMERAMCISKSGKVTFESFSKNIKRILVEDVIELTFFVNIPETLTDKSFTAFLELAQKIYYLFPARIHFLLIFDQKWDEDNFFNLTMPFRSLFQNTSELPLYSDSETLYFASHLCSRWHFKLSKNTLLYIVQEAGGILLLAKAGVRIAVKENLNRLSQIQKVTRSHPDYLLQIRFFLSRLTERQREILKKIANLSPVEDSLELDHLESMRIIEKTLQGWQVRSLALQNFLRDKTVSVDRIIKTVRGSETLSSREKKIVLKLIGKNGDILSRDEIADIIWKEKKYDQFSDWAIDKTISRIRKKIDKIPSLSELTIETRKKKGVSLRVL